MFHIIDDDAVLRDLHKELVGIAGYSATCFASGEDYLEHLQSPDFQKPTAILSDVTMPGINGYDLTLEIRKMIPHQIIVLITGSADGEHHQASADELCHTLEKPYKPGEFISLINALAGCKEKHADGKVPYPEKCEYNNEINCPFSSELNK